MVAVLVAVTILALVALDYFVLRKRRQETTVIAETALPILAPLSDAVMHVPRGVFLQPTFTWSRLQSDGDFTVGVHPLLFGLVGPPYELMLRSPGDRIEKGEPLLRIGKGDRELIVRSPMAGRVDVVNGHVVGESDWTSIASGNGSWVYRIEPQSVSSDIATWMVADRATDWTELQYDRLKDHLTRLTQWPEVGVTLADGGEVPTGILASLDVGAWAEIQRMFL